MGPPDGAAAGPILAPAQGLKLIELARAAIAAALAGRQPPVPPAEAFLYEARGVFVTLRGGQDLRGCIGYPLPVKPLGLAVIETAVAAACNDPRFEPLRARELAVITIEVSVLSVPRAASEPLAIEPGRHGLIVTQGARRGLLLPQVASEHGWDAETFLSQTCLKAGLEPDAWRRGARFEIFEAQVFEEGVEG
jgi:AmmeMemoRadiSam system protein A